MGLSFLLRTRALRHLGDVSCVHGESVSARKATNASTPPKARRSPVCGFSSEARQTDWPSWLPAATCAACTTDRLPSGMLLASWGESSSEKPGVELVATRWRWRKCGLSIPPESPAASRYRFACSNTISDILRPGGTSFPGAIHSPDEWESIVRPGPGCHCRVIARKPSCRFRSRRHAGSLQHNRVAKTWRRSPGAPECNTIATRPHRYSDPSELAVTRPRTLLVGRLPDRSGWKPGDGVQIQQGARRLAYLAVGPTVRIAARRWRDCFGPLARP